MKHFNIWLALLSTFAVLAAGCERDTSRKQRLAKEKAAREAQSAKEEAARRLTDERQKGVQRYVQERLANEERAKRAHELEGRSFNVNWDDQYLRLNNTGKSRRQFEIHLNEINTYCCSVELDAGEQRTISLRDITTRGGVRFNPQAIKVLRVFVGGYGYDYNEFK